MNALHRALSRLVELEESLSVDVDGTIWKVSKAYPYPPYGNKGLDTPCVIHTWRFEREQRNPNAWRQRFYTVRLQVMIGRSGANTMMLGQVAAAFDEQAMDTLDRNIQLDDPQLFTKLRGEESVDQPAIYDFNRIGYVGLEYLVDLVVTEPTLVGA